MQDVILVHFEWLVHLLVLTVYIKNGVSRELY